MVAEPLKQSLFPRVDASSIRLQGHIFQPYFHLWPQRKKLQEGKGEATEDIGHRGYFKNSWQTVGLMKELTQHEDFKIHNKQDSIIYFSFFF